MVGQWIEYIQVVVDFGIVYILNVCLWWSSLVSFFLTDGLWKLARYEGVRGLYKGFAPGLFGVSHGAIQFMSYEELKRAYCSRHRLPHNTKLVRWLDRTDIVGGHDFFAMQECYVFWMCMLSAVMRHPRS